MTTRQILINAKAMIPQRHNWLQGRAFGVHWAPDGTRERCMCPSHAIISAAAHEPFFDAAEAALKFYREATGIGPNETIASWNDVKWRTYDEVMAGFDNAIELAP